MISDINSIMNEDIDNKDNKEEGEEAVVLDEVAAGVEPEETVIPFTRQEEEQPLTMEEEIEETEQIEKKLTGELAKIFRKYRDMPGLEEQLADLFDTIDDEMQMNSSASGNILISEDLREQLLSLKAQEQSSLRELMNCLTVLNRIQEE